MSQIDLNAQYNGNLQDGLEAKTIGNMIPLTPLRHLKKKKCIVCKREFEGGSSAKYCIDHKPFLK